MKFGIFYEHQLPRPWQEDSELRIYQDSLDQIELADKLGFDYVWEVEHHFLEEYSHSPAPEVFLAAASQRTKQIRLGHGVVLLPHAYNHPARVAERIAALDLVSNGRVDFGTGESSSEMELGGFGIPRAEKRAMWEESLSTIVRMFVEEPFAGFDGKYLQMPPRNVIPKPIQKPHPPLWVACSRRETINLAAKYGMGALSFSFGTPEEARTWVTEYYRILREECTPIGYAINPHLAIVSTLMCGQSEEEAINKGLGGAEFFGFSLAHYYIFGQHTPGRTNIWESFEHNRGQYALGQRIEESGGTLRFGEPIVQQGLSALRGCIGTPDQIRPFLSAMEEAGVDQVIFVSQGGRNKHEDICDSLELFAKTVMPEFKEREEKRERKKAAEMAPVIEKALMQRRPNRHPGVDLIVPAAAAI